MNCTVPRITGGVMLLAALVTGFALADVSRNELTGYLRMIEAGTLTLETADTGESVREALNALRNAFGRIRDRAPELVDEFFAEDEAAVTDMAETSWELSDVAAGIRDMVSGLWSSIDDAGVHLGLIPAGTDTGPLPVFTRGDSNGDGGLDVSDAVHLFRYLFTGGTAPPCEKAADSNDDGSLDVSDPVQLLGYLFRTDPESLPWPARFCGADRTEDPLDCNVSTCI